MREIKFRGKSVETGEWVYGSLFVSKETFYILENEYIDVGDTDIGLIFIEVYPKTVGQYLNIKDKNKKELYQNDICKNEICWDEPKEVSTNDIGTICSLDDSGESSFDTIVLDGIEIIGNKHDNPEL